MYQAHLGPLIEEVAQYTLIVYLLMFFLYMYLIANPDLLLYIFCEKGLVAVYCINLSFLTCLASFLVYLLVNVIPFQQRCLLP